MWGKSAIRESDPRNKLGKLMHYHCANGAGQLSVVIQI